MALQIHTFYKKKNNKKKNVNIMIIEKNTLNERITAILNSDGKEGINEYMVIELEGEKHSYVQTISVKVAKPSVIKEELLQLYSMMIINEGESFTNLIFNFVLVKDEVKYNEKFKSNIDSKKFEELKNLGLDPINEIANVIVDELFASILDTILKK